MAHALEIQAKKAVDLLDQLTHKAEGDAKRPHLTGGLNGSEIAQAAGVAFLFSRKGGVGVTLSMGTGFVIAKVPGKPGWSAPLIFRVTSGGLGVSLGYAEVETLTILDSTAAVQEFLKTQVSLDSHLSVALGARMAGDASETAVDFTAPRESLKKFSYSVNKGMMLDASWNGSGISLNDEDQVAMYGEGVSKEDILAGKVNPPEFLTELYGALNRLAYFGDSPTDSAAEPAKGIPVDARL